MTPPLPVALDPDKTLLRFITCGSVDDGKSTLIGRLLHDSRLILDDHAQALARASRRRGAADDEADLSLLVDGLEAEREQGITIDVAYRYFTTPRRSFIVADTPGHEQFTRNMATGASTADLAVILADARKGVLTQTKRHSAICALLGVRRMVLAVNKIDLVENAEAVFGQIVEEYEAFAARLGLAAVQAIPVSARFGDNVAERSTRTPWYGGPTLLAHLDTVEAAPPQADAPLRFPVQWINRPDPEFRGIAGTVASGVVRAGDAVVVATTGATARVARIVTYDGDRTAAHAGEAVTLTLDAPLDVARGDLLVPPDARPDVADQFAARLIWMDATPMLPGRSYLLFTGTRATPARVTALKHRIDVDTLGEAAAQTLALNEIGQVNIATQTPIAFDPYRRNRVCGAFVLIDRATNATVAAGMIDFALRRASNIHRHAHAVDKASRAAALGQRPLVVWFTGLSGCGKSTIADLVEQALHQAGRHTMLLDGDNLRHGLNRDLGFTDADRVENIRRAGEAARLMADAGLIVLCSFISPFAADRAMVREMLAPGEFLEVFVDASLEACIARDPKGLYKKALAGEIPNFTGVGSPYERPQAPDLRIDAERDSPQEAARRVLDAIAARQGSP